MKERLDKTLVIRKIAPTRAKAQELIKSNYVIVNGIVRNKMSFMIEDKDVIQLIENNTLKYVSRGGLKLEKAINFFKIDLNGKNIMDIGSSTGGFCDCAIQHGANHIIAIDVGTNLLHQSLRKNKKITLYENTNFKDIDFSNLGEIDFITCDVSFISLKQIILKLSGEKLKFDGVFLIKPQFECGKEIADKYKGIITNRKIHLDIIRNLFVFFEKNDFFVIGFTSSPIKGGDGNIEYLVYLTNKKKGKVNVDINSVITHAFDNK